jgi:TetR/AcrR family transcriptional regulator, regulator of cefoperazone and chloramphenicol sensitivity
MLRTETHQSEGDPLSDTQRRIIEAAGEIFADSGYRYTTIRLISERADVNVAAINYHFGGKKNLYLGVLKYWRTKAFEKYPFDPSDYSTGSPQERLKTFIRVLLFRILDEGEGSRFARLMAQEFIQPTAGLDMIVEETMRPLFAFLSTTVRQLFKGRPSEQTVVLCCASIVGQVFQFYLGRHVMRRLLDRDSLDRQEIETVADHIARFSLFAINSIAAESEGESR